MIHFEHANIVHCGDLVFNRRYPFVDMKAGASTKHWSVALERAQKHRLSYQQKDPAIKNQVAAVHYVACSKWIIASPLVWPGPK